MMVGLFGLLASFVIGTVVSTLERRGDEGSEVTAIATAGAVFGAYVGRMLGLYVAFGELPGFICSAAGAVALVRIYRWQAVGMKTRDLALPVSREYPPATSEPRPPAPPAMESRERPQTIPSLLAEAFGWGATCAITTAAAGFTGHFIGGQLYPQRYEQIPSDFFFVPLGLIVGFVAGGMGRLAGRNWAALTMVAFIGLASIVYGGAMFHYSQIRAIPAQITATLEPVAVEPIGCSPATCTATDPPSQWYVSGRLRLKETSGLGATIDRIEITSNTDVLGPITRHPYTKEGAADAAKWSGPLLMLTGRHVPGPRRLGGNTESTYDIVYPYHT